MIGSGADDDLIEYVADERGLLLRWIEWVTQLDPDILIGWNVINFDLRLLQQRRGSSTACRLPSVACRRLNRCGDSRRRIATTTSC